MKNVVVIYEKYEEYNQFEGQWHAGRERFNSIPEAERWIARVKSNSTIKNIEGPFVRPRL